MRRLIFGILAAVLVLCAGTMGVFAACRGGGRQTTALRGTGTCVCGQNYRDLNGNGICDFCAGARFVDTNGDGICDHYTGTSHHGGHGRWCR